MSNASAVDVEVRLRLKDGAVAGEMKAIEKVAEQVADRTASATERAAKRAAEATERGNTRQRASYEKTALARETLGVRSEKLIQKEIENTRRSYATLAAAGFASAQEQERAYAAVQSRITRLTNEMGKLTAAQKKAADEAKRLAQIEADQARGQRTLRAGVAGVAGAGAAAYTLRGPANQAMSFDERLAHMANTAFAERDAAGRRIGSQQLEAAVNRAVGKGGGGTREQAAEALDAMIASGAMSANDAMGMLPQIMRFATASGADPNALAQIGIRSMQTFRIRPEDMPNVLNMAVAAGQEGGFELKDMAKWLPQQMAAASLSGLTGRAGFAKLAALNQAAAITAGSKDEAGNNVVNLLAKINSNDTANDAKKLGIDLPKYLQQRRAKGVDSVDAFGELIDKTVAGRSDYKALQAKLAGAKTDDGKRDALEAMATIAQGAGIGKLIQDRQAMMALLGMMNNREYMQKVLGTVRANDVATGGAGDKNYEGISATSSFKLRQAIEQKEIGQKAAMDSLTPAIGKAAEAFGDLATKYPLLTGVTTLATAALAALAGAAGMAAFAMGGKVPGTGAIGRYAGKVGGVAGVAGVAGIGAMAGGWALDKGFGEDSAISRYGSNALNGAAIGATLGSIVPVIGTGVGAAAGGILGLIYQGLKDIAPAEQKPLDVNAKLQVGLAPGLVLQSQSVQSTGGNVYMNTGNLMSGAP